ncbi:MULTISPECIES: YggS family pyridoxal phosphate-dependent enzyme [Corallincola]|uniref:Pyridoxal phosphate homeostasis protein n=3 Tax=Corallincola TaxID=1775176 RepID=A0A368N685_9GAMM|nr:MULTISPECIES: YggS family pyridoxal phosphate-dependent enzyme [Corallincola]RCU45650.1 YggS family pyridoxal phosphate-dependent enzyme [Corallincola holothuriorum]TAA41774.1 YggS family pyridoxal phosphate-dependent enzyme [Corallincola spongiicola]TCI02235.1 YggS family pyridoxal phosphate-dependent enzyme [Corallincola luteus]
MSDLTVRLQSSQQRINAACTEAGREADSVTLLAVSKTKPAAAILEAVAAGQRCFGENYVQEAVDKIVAIANPQLEWHFIGPIQSNKTRLLAEHFDWVQSVDRIKIAKRLSEQRPSHLTPLKICIQVNISDEPQKAGISLEALPDLAQQVTELPNLQLRGLMAIPADVDDYQAQRAQFKRLNTAFINLQQHHPELDTLSMGMSGDLEAAIAEGATMVRIGTAIFGARAPK